MFLHHDVEARAIFVRYRGHKVDANNSWEAIILADFDRHRTAHRSHPMMDAIAKLLVEPVPPRDNSGLAGQDDDIGFDVAKADDVEAGDLLVARGRFDEAIAVYRRRLDICASNIANNRLIGRYVDERTRAVAGIGNVAFRHLLARQFDGALKAVDHGLAATAGVPQLRIQRAHALMFLERIDEAREIYLGLCDLKVDADATGAQRISQDFATMRRAGLTHPLMEELEKPSSRLPASSRPMR
jgi:tetratricopeptide (TPR) repeat protein